MTKCLRLSTVPKTNRRKQLSPIIQRANERQLESVLRWLRRTDLKGEEGFWGNRKLIRRWFKENTMFVCVDAGSVVGFMVGYFGRNSILEVRPRSRTKGYGRMLAEDWLQRADQAGVCLLDIECRPFTSVPFWKKLGFLPRTDQIECDKYYLEIKKTLPLPTSGAPCQIEIEILHEESLRSPKTEPLVSAKFHGMEVDGLAYLQERFICDAYRRTLGDPVLKIVIDSQIIYFAKAKRIQAAAMGQQIAPCSTPYIDRIILNEPFCEASYLSIDYRQHAKKPPG